MEFLSGAYWKLGGCIELSVLLRGVNMRALCRLFSKSGFMASFGLACSAGASYRFNSLYLGYQYGQLCFYFMRSDLKAKDMSRLIAVACTFK